MEETVFTSSAPPHTTPATSRAGTTQTRHRRAPRPARPRTATTLSAAILTDRGLAEGYVALPLARLMASRVWGSIETLNQQLALLEHHSFTRMTSDPAFEAQGKALQQLLRAYALLTTQVADLALRLAQNRLTEADRLTLATRSLALMLPEAPSAPASPPAEPPGATVPTMGAEAIPGTYSALEADGPAHAAEPAPVSTPLVSAQICSSGES